LADVLHKLFGRALLNNMATLKNEDLVGRCNGRLAMGDHKERVVVRAVLLEVKQDIPSTYSGW